MMRGPATARIVALTIATGGISHAAGSPPHFFYLDKYGDNAWFVDEVAGAKAEAEKLGDQFTSQDLQADANRAITAVDTAIGAGAAGIAIVVPDQQIGPAVLKRAQDAAIPMIAVDDEIKDASGKPAPFVGFSAVEIGKQVGVAIADFHHKLGWEKPDSKTKLLVVEYQTLSVCMDRTDNSIAVLKQALGLSDDQILRAPYKGTLDTALAGVSQAITAYPQVSRWLIASCNDDGVLGAVRALEQAGFKADAMIGVGINGQLACEEFKKADATGFRGSIFVDSKVHGATAIRLLYANVVDKQPIPARTIIKGQLITRDDNAKACHS
jgi:L-arabinose transport system substrate-binding protein